MPSKPQSRLSRRVQKSRWPKARRYSCLLYCYLLRSVCPSSIGTQPQETRGTRPSLIHWNFHAMCLEGQSLQMANEMRK